MAEKPVQIGDIAPDFTLSSPDGKRHSLSSYRGQKVMLSFLRFASCSLCQLDVDHLKRRSSLYERGKVTVICVLQSTPETMKRYIMRQEPPFACLSDPEMKVYRVYNVKTSKCGYRKACAKFFFLNRPHGGLVRSAWKGFLAPHEPGSEDHLLPAEFLIDENGKVVDVFHAKTADEHMPWSRIRAFMPVDPLCAPCRRGLRGRFFAKKSEDEDEDTGGIYMG